MELPAFVYTYHRKLRWPSAREHNEINRFAYMCAFPYSSRSYLLPGECRHIGVPRAPVAPIEPSIPLAFMCPLLATDSRPQPTPVSAAASDDDFLSDGRSSFAWQVRVAFSKRIF